MKVGIDAAIDDAQLRLFEGLDIVRIPAEPPQDIAVDFWIPAVSGAVAAKQWPRLTGVKVVHGLWAGVEWLRPMIPRGVTLCNGRGVFDTPVAEWVVGVILAMQKYLPFYLSLQARGDWSGKRGAEELFMMTEGAERDAEFPALADGIAGKTVLIVGYGSIGKAVEARLAPFDCTILRVARTAKPGVEPVAALDRLLPLADIVVLILPSTPDTRHLFDAARLARMKRGALLVNAGRGSVIDTDALVAALTAKRLRAAVDVTDPEPLPPVHPLWRAPNVLITPHVASDTPRAMERALGFVALQAGRYARGEPLENVIAGDY
jgi:phosphoglycerate dehydrogenase-like enzyme